MYPISYAYIYTYVYVHLYISEMNDNDNTGGEREKLGLFCYKVLTLLVK